MRQEQACRRPSAAWLIRTETRSSPKGRRRSAAASAARRHQFLIERCLHLAGDAARA